RGEEFGGAGSGPAHQIDGRHEREGERDEDDHPVEGGQLHGVLLTRRTRRVRVRFGSEWRSPQEHASVPTRSSRRSAPAAWARCIGTPGDIAGAVHWLLSPDSAWVTGQVIGVDGGLAGLKGRVRQ
ncbi:MAG: SDR family oxidoreductase, partial [Acidobacteria bacterium]|nr:SDR family oxidoreductase [Acidobacteriota bacterium]